MNQQCKVCGEPAAGFHFGAFTCEGCKSFFGRTNNNQSAISECKNNGECVINKKNRTSCKACRLKKCIMVGMSKSSSRYGRRSNWFKIHCLMDDMNNQNNLNNISNITNLNLNNMSALSGLSGGAAAAAGGAGAATPTPGAGAAAFFGGGAGLYPTSLLQGHFLSPERLLASPTLSWQVKKRKASAGGDDSGRHSRSSAEDSAGSSAGDAPAADDDSGSRPASALSFLRPPSSQQSPSPFSDKDYYQTHRRLSATVTLALPASPVGGQTSSPALAAAAAAAAAPFASPLFGPYAPASARFLYPGLAGAAAAVRPGVAPAQPGLLYSPVPVRAGAGGDLLLCSPALAGVAVEQDQPIDLSVKSPSAITALRCASSPGSPSRSPGATPPGLCPDDRPCGDAVKAATCPLDLTNKRGAEVPQSG
ncbi:hypothetical protein R5R35_005780 [Gryllus longicercus]|uniref:Nuclear receptor domain-containing protein n=1 Tax=Gryllus longicercus TaxID=2509291 RepID=A0AAN9ZI50_9ORTH